MTQTTIETAKLKLVLEALCTTANPKAEEAINALEKSIAKQKKKRPQNCGTSYCSCIECVMDDQDQGEPVAYDVRCDNCGGDGYDPKDNNYFCSGCEGSGFLEKLFYTTPPQRKPLTRDRVKEILTEAGYDTSNVQSRADFINGLRHGEAAHGIKE